MNSGDASARAARPPHLPLLPPARQPRGAPRGGPALSALRPRAGLPLGARDSGGRWRSASPPSWRGGVGGGSQRPPASHRERPPVELSRSRASRSRPPLSPPPSIATPSIDFASTPAQNASTHPEKFAHGRVAGSSGLC